MQLRVLALVIGALDWGIAAAAPAAARPVVMVIYFDNLTGQLENDVMKKGLADMIITDLIAHDGVTVVERDKLEAVLGELKLQGSAAFDAATRAKAGKLVGARYMISGSMLGVTPEVRIDARLTDVTTGVDVTAASVRGAPARLFDLEQELVAKLTSSIDAKLANPTAARKMKGVDVDIVRAYSRALDLEDKGKLEEARKLYSEVLKQKPTFALPRDRTEKLVKRMAELATMRSTALSSAAQTLAKAIDQALAANFDQLPLDKKGEYLAIRLVRGHLLGRLLKEHLVTRPYPNVVLKGHEAAALKLLREIYANLELTRQEAEHYRSQLGPNGWPKVQLPEDLDRIVKEAQLTGHAAIDEDTLLCKEGQLVLLGEIEDGEHRYHLGPTLGDLDATLWSAVLAALDRRVDTLLRSNKARAELAVHTALELQADGLLHVGKTEEAIAKLQRFLDEYPTSTLFSNVTRRINVELGVERSAVQEDILNYPDNGLKQCDYFVLARGFEQIIHRRVAVRGAAAIGETVAEIERACGGRKLYWDSLYAMFARNAAAYGECDLSRALWRKYLDHNGSRRDLDGWQNSQPECVIFP
jgi:TolB-like protein